MLVYHEIDLDETCDTFRRYKVRSFSAREASCYNDPQQENMYLCSSKYRYHSLSLSFFLFFFFFIFFSVSVSVLSLLSPPWSLMPPSQGRPCGDIAGQECVINRVEQTSESERKRRGLERTALSFSPTALKESLGEKA